MINKRIWFVENQTDNFNDFQAFCEVNNYHLDACTKRKIGIGEMYESYKFVGPNQDKHLSSIIIRDAQTNKCFVISFETTEGKYNALHLSPESSEVRTYAYKQWKRLEEKNRKFYETSTYEI